MKRKKETVDEPAEMFAGTEAPPPLAAALTPLDIQQKEFRVSRMGGYRMRDVDEFLDVVTDRVSTLIAENERLQALVASADGRRQEQPDAPAAGPIPRDDPGAVQGFLRKEGEFLRSLGALVQGHVEGVKEMARIAKAPSATPEVVEGSPADAGLSESAAADAGPADAVPPVQVPPAADALPTERVSEEPQHASSRRTDDRSEGSLRELFWGEEG